MCIRASYNTMLAGSIPPYYTDPEESHADPDLIYVASKSGSMDADVYKRQVCALCWMNPMRRLVTRSVKPSKLTACPTCWYWALRLSLIHI